MDVLANVKLVKFPELDEVDLGLFNTALAHFFKRVGDGVTLQLSLKEYNKGGLRAQHEIHATAVLNGDKFFAEHTDWLLLEVVQHVLKTLEKEIKKKESLKN